MKFDRIEYWSEVKLEIVRKYARAYSTVLSAQTRPRLEHVYIDGFAGPGVAQRRSSGELVPGSPLNALDVKPPFWRYFLIDLDGDKVANLRRMVGQRSDVEILKGDCNQLLLERVFPHVQFEQFRRGLCLLDPYGLHLDWSVTERAGRMKTIDLFLNFPVMDMNRNALWKNPDGVDPKDLARMTAFWGDESWRQIVYRSRKQGTFFGPELEKVGNEDVAEAFRTRLQKVAGFRHVPAPLPMHNRQGPIIYYLFFASQKDVANKIVKDIFKKYREGKP
jgi:three-Cys-motif partner protein